MTITMEQIENFLKAIHPHASKDIQGDLEKHFPALFPKDVPLEPGYHRDSQGVLWVLTDRVTCYSMSSPYKVMACTCDATNLFYKNNEYEERELRTILATMERVENP